MNLENITWNEQNYQLFINHLKENVNQEYKTFNTRLLNTKSEVIGNNIPFIRNIAKQIKKGDYKGFFAINKHHYYEETTIQGIIIGELKLDIEETIDYLKKYTKYIDNWATNDVVANSLKIFKQEKSRGIQYIKELVKSDHPFEVRFGLILLLCHYIEEDYIDQIIDISTKVKSSDYYILMGNAWLLSMCYFKFKDKILYLLKNNILETKLHNKTIQKIKESNRITKEEKIYLSSIKR